MGLSQKRIDPYGIETKKDWSLRDITKKGYNQTGMKPTQDVFFLFNIQLLLHNQELRKNVSIFVIKLHILLY